MNLIVLMLAIVAGFQFAQADTATTTCGHLGDGVVVAAVDAATWTTCVEMYRKSSRPRRGDVRVNIPDWQSQWLCRSWTAELVLPYCVETRTSHHAAPGDWIAPDESAKLTTADGHHWIARLRGSEHLTGMAEDRECFALLTSQARDMRGWIRLKVHWNDGSTLALDGEKHYRLLPVTFRSER